MANYSNILAWKVPWTEEPGGLPSIGLHRVSQTTTALLLVPKAVSAP